MSLGTEGSVLQLVEDMGDVGESKTILKSNGEYHDDYKLLEGIGLSPEGMGSSSPATTKRQGLKKWRRVPRELARKASGSLDSKINGDLTGLSGEMEQGINGSISLLHDMVNVNGDDLIHSVHNGDLGEDSENSGGHSSRSSTAEIRRNGVTGTTKKARGVKIEKENSYSSMESDSRSCNFVFVQGTNSVANNGRQSGRLANYNEEYGDEYLSEEARISFRKNEAESEDAPQEDLAAGNSWEVKEENLENRMGSSDLDALVESITELDSAHRELEREVQKWKDIGKDDDSVQPSELTSVYPQDCERVKEAETSGDTKNELEDFLKKIIQADVECVAINTTTENLWVGPLHEMKLKLQEKVASEEKSETTENVKKLGNRARRFTWCFMIQLILLIVIFYLQFFSQNVEVVPT